MPYLLSASCILCNPENETVISSEMSVNFCHISQHCITEDSTLQLVETFYFDAGFEVLTAVVMKCSVFWNVTLCSLLNLSDVLEDMLPPSSGLSRKLSKKPV
jgi:hypothetical protein